MNTPKPEAPVLETIPPIVCLCGSTRFHAEFDAANERETLAGKVVLSVGCWRRTAPDGGRPDFEEKVKLMLDDLHLQKIGLADEVLVINVGGYIGRSTKREVWYAKNIGKKVRWLEPVGVLTETEIGVMVDSWFADWDVWREEATAAAA